MKSTQASPAAEALISPPPSGWRKRVVNFAIIAFLATQIAIPASYYLLNDEPTSERFSWRMFSSIDLSRWDCVFRERVESGSRQAERVIPIESFLQETTCVSIRAAQLDIIRKFMRTRVQHPEVQAVILDAYGTAPSGKSLGPIRLIVERADAVVRRVEP